MIHTSHPKLLLCCVPSGTRNSDLVTAAITGVVVTKDIPEGACDTKGIFTVAPPFPFHVWDIFGSVLFHPLKEN